MLEITCRRYLRGFFQILNHSDLIAVFLHVNIHVLCCMLTKYLAWKHIYHMSTYGKYSPPFIFAPFALVSVGEFKTVQIPMSQIINL